jgi:hypothetical protein
MVFGCMVMVQNCRHVMEKPSTGERECPSSLSVGTLLVDSGGRVALKVPRLEGELYSKWSPGRQTTGTKNMTCIY